MNQKLSLFYHVYLSNSCFCIVFLFPALVIHLGYFFCSICYTIHHRKCSFSQLGLSEREREKNRWSHRGKRELRRPPPDKHQVGDMVKCRTIFTEYWGVILWKESPKLSVYLMILIYFWYPDISCLISPVYDFLLVSFSRHDEA